MSGPQSRSPASIATPKASRIRADRRAQVLDCAKKIFSRKGFHSASISDIVNQARIARGTFYLYFENKRDIFDSLLEELLAELRSRIRPVDLAPGSPPPLVQVKANIRRVLELVRDEPELMRILLHHAPGLDEQSAQIVRAFYERVLTLVARSLEHGKRLGLIRECDTRVAAACVLGIMKEATDLLTAGREAPSTLEVVVEEVIDFGLRGLFVPGGKE